jgi:hypothetical protein
MKQNMIHLMRNISFKVSVELAKECARTAPSNDERTKKLWLKIGKK